jgi:uncharacterized protein
VSPDAESPDDLFRILAIDGGGMRGLISALVMEEIEARLGERLGAEQPPRISDYFHLVAGTSAGGLAALALTAPTGLGAGDLVAFYREDGPRIFRRGLGRRLATGWGLFGPKYSAEPLREAIEARVGPSRIADATRDLLVASYDMHGSEPHFFKRWRALESPERNPTVVAAALATAAAPTYFPSQQLGEGALVDGGVFANDPAVAAIAEALGRQSDPPARLEPSNILMVSIGTGEFEVGYEQRQVRRWGALRWVLGRSGPPILNTILGGVTDATDYWAHMLLNHDPGEGVPEPAEIGRGPRYYRLQAKLDGPLALDETSAETLDVVLPGAAAALIEKRDAELDGIVARLLAAPPVEQSAAPA